MASSTQDPGEFVFYHYDPSLPAACIFIALFGISFVSHVFQMIKFRSWYFVPFLIGCCCGAILSRAKSLSDVDLGENIIIAGLAVQIAFFGVFITVICLFHYRINRSPTGPCSSVTLRWRPFIWILYGASILIMVRSVFRVAEYVTGSNGALMASEVYIYVFDAALMFLVAAMFNFFHPGKIIQMDHKLIAISGSSMTVGLQTLS
ncbi:hypothetical protein CcaCcLH18_03491 [Colletotrichum camelliae]|nr:hypothetical protein CcaCcLH18_03491 [Colletotrichum camelliae]